MRIREEIEEGRRCNADVYLLFFCAQFDPRHLLSVKVKPLFRAIQCCCRSFNVPLLRFVRFIKTILAMVTTKNHGREKKYDSVKNNLFIRIKRLAITKLY